MNLSVRPLMLTAAVIATLIVAGFAALYVLDLMPKEDLQETFMKTLLVFVVGMIAMFAIFGIVKIASKD